MPWRQVRRSAGVPPRPAATPLDQQPDLRQRLSDSFSWQVDDGDCAGVAFKHEQAPVGIVKFQIGDLPHYWATGMLPISASWAADARLAAPIAAASANRVIVAARQHGMQPP